MNVLPEGAALCTSCQSWQFTRRFLSLSTKFVLMLLAPLAAWAIAYAYQRGETVRAATQVGISHLSGQIEEILDLNKDFQVAFDSLFESCGKDSLQVNNLCLSEYLHRLIVFNGLVSQVSWKSGLLPLPAEAVAIETKWQNIWWGVDDPPGVTNRLRSGFLTMAADGRLLKCQALAFSNSECAASLSPDLERFRTETAKVMCVLSLALRRHLLALYSSLPSSEETTSLVRDMRTHMARSSCNSLLPPAPP